MTEEEANKRAEEAYPDWKDVDEHGFGTYFFPSYERAAYARGYMEGYAIGLELGLKTVNQVTSTFEQIRGWVARDKNGEVFFYKEKPVRRECAWYSNDRYTFLGEDILLTIPNDIKWEDEPMEITLKISKL
jgi:hypothetical protein